MDREELREYLRVVTDMEAEIFLQGQLANVLEKQMASLGNTTYIEEPVGRIDDVFGNGVIGSILGAFAGAVLGAILGFFMPKIRWYVGMWYGVALGAVITFVLGIWTTIVENKQAKALYEEQKEQYKNALIKEEERVNRENKILIHLRREYDALQKKMKESKHILEAMYSKDIIYSKYRNFVMVASLYEYIDSGQCSTLTGHEGAYNVLKQEMLLQNIVTRLDYVISQLEQIKNNQFMIYDAIRKSNQMLSEILESNNSIAAHVAQIEQQGDEMISRISDLQRDSKFNLYLTAVSAKEMTYRNQFGI